MPALLLLVRIDWITLPVPYFLIWLLAFPFMVIAFTVGLLVSPFKSDGWTAVLLSMPLLFYFITCLHGLRVFIESREKRIRILFL